MAVILLVLGLSLLMQGCVCSMEDTGCMSFYPKGDDVCCKACHPGNRLVERCGPDPKKLCEPCKPKTFITSPLKRSCDVCRQCVESLVLVKECTATSDTVCGCKEGLTCGNDPCTFCVKMCGKGQEPAAENSCRPCPEGTFNNQTHQKCKPWSTKCPDPDQHIVVFGDAFSDIKCSQMGETKTPGRPEDENQVWLLAMYAGFGILMICVVVTLSWKIHQRRTRKEKEIEQPELMSETMIIRPPSDEPRTLIAFECSFHEAQQEQGSSSESLASKDSSEQLLP
ncbi:tumor necrosis factor receptor superfamily member 9-like [Halichoeres trimaculatus]|uniref:tumor necrosis factor receptor superfamily member 9-like n=1 Tax=Halichoeres trimaculatus TaxID=147232 RepID=UPI003D9F6095